MFDPLTFNLPDKPRYPHPLRNKDVAIAIGWQEGVDLLSGWGGDKDTLLWPCTSAQVVPGGGGAVLGVLQLLGIQELWVKSPGLVELCCAVLRPGSVSIPRLDSLILLFIEEYSYIDGVK